MSSPSSNDPTVVRPSSDPYATEYFDGSAGVGASAFLPGFVLAGKFRLEKQLGRGGMGEAWKAFDTLAERSVVLKFVPKEIQHVKEAMDSVKDSFKKVHALQHQHICPVYDLFQDEHHGLCLVMKYIDGRPLDEYRRKLIEKNKNLSFGDLVQILWGVAQGLDYAHEKKVVHRDIKPQNIMVGKTDGVQIIDFGLAEEIRSSMVRFSEVTMDVAGTRPYMAPEQWQGKYQDAATDQYALAVTAYELFSGRVPFQGSDIGILRECVLHETPDPIPNLPDYINAALLKALSKKREDRFEHCKAFIRAMTAKPKKVAETPDEIEGVPEKVVSPPPFPTIQLKSEKQEPDETVWKPPRISTDAASRPAAAPVRRKPVPLYASVAVGVAVVILGLVFAFSGKSEPKKASVAEKEKPKQTQKKERSTVNSDVTTSSKFADPAVLSDAEKKELQQKYPEFDWTGANVVVLPELSEDALRQAFKNASETKENDFIVVRTTKEKHRIVLEGGSFEFVVNAEEKGEVTLIGFGPEKLVLDGNGKDRIFLAQKNAVVGFAGIIFTNGLVVDKTGGAMVVNEHSKAVLLHCDFVGNACVPETKSIWWSSFGGGAVCSWNHSSLVLRDVCFERNRNNRLEAFENPRPADLKICFDSSAGLVLTDDVSLVATNVVFRDNLGGAMFLHSMKSVEMLNISLVGNKSFGGGTIHLNGKDPEQSYKITNLFATGNESGQFGGALHVGGKGRYVLDHLTLVGNHGDNGGGLCLGGGGDYGIDASEVRLTNSIIVGNRGKHVSNFDTNHGQIGKLDIRNCVTSENKDRIGKPFVSEQNNRFLKLSDLKFGELQDFGNGLPVMPLLEGSPAIDAGSATEHSPKTDITGRPRKVGKAPDIGVFEWQSQEDAGKTVEIPVDRTDKFAKPEKIRFTLEMSEKGEAKLRVEKSDDKQKPVFDGKPVTLPDFPKLEVKMRPDGISQVVYDCRSPLPTPLLYSPMNVELDNHAGKLTLRPNSVAQPGERTDGWCVLGLEKIMRLPMKISFDATVTHRGECCNFEMLFPENILTCHLYSRGEKFEDDLRVLCRIGDKPFSGGTGRVYQEVFSTNFSLKKPYESAFTVNQLKNEVGETFRGGIGRNLNHPEGIEIIRSPLEINRVSFEGRLDLPM